MKSDYILQFSKQNSHQKTDYLKKKLVTPITINNLGSNSEFSDSSNNNINGIEIINSSRDNSQESSSFSVSSSDTYVLKNSKVFYL